MTKCSEIRPPAGGGGGGGAVLEFQQSLPKRRIAFYKINIYSIYKRKLKRNILIKLITLVTFQKQVPITLYVKIEY